jgi:hypothetical protein
MAKISYIDLLPSAVEMYFKNLNAQSRFIHAHVAMKKTLLSPKNIKGLTQRSLLPQIATDWNALSESQKTAWSSAGAESNLNGYRLFVQDKCLRVKNGLAGNATPSLLHQSSVGALEIESPASELKIAQLHPRSYWVSHPVYGKKGMREPVIVTEDFGLPLVLSLNYRAELSAVSGSSFAKFYAQIWSSYQGRDIITDLEIPLDLATDWKNANITCSSVIGYVVGYSLYFHLFDVRGILYIDNVKATHSGQNWVRDTFCKDIEQGFTKAFFQIPKHWSPVILPDGAEFNSIYKDF